MYVPPSSDSHILARRQYEESWKKMQELRAQIQAQLRLADHLRKLGEQGGWMFICIF